MWGTQGVLMNQASGSAIWLAGVLHNAIEKLIGIMAECSSGITIKLPSYADQVKHAKAW
jgi:hypothetical protein